MNVVFGIGIAVLLFILVMLGTRVFYPEPLYEDYCNQSIYSQPVGIYDYAMCVDNITVGSCRLQIQNSSKSIYEKQNAEQEKCNTAFQEASKSYGKNLFVINNVVGIIAVIVSMFLFAMVNIAAGVSFAGLILIIYGFMRGWQGTGDILKFVVAFIVTTLFIFLAVKVNRIYSGGKKRK